VTILPKEILVPTDFSESSKVALAWATGLCDGCSASLHLLHVLETVTVADPVDVPFDSRTQVTQAIEATAWDDLRSLLSDEDRERLNVTLTVEWGLPVVEIVRYASAHSIGLIAMGTHGHRHMKEMWLGSVAATVVRDAPCTVLVVRSLTDGHHQDVNKLIDR
jgi:nucleotide-binding universal stress UspA family protein